MVALLALAGCGAHESPRPPAAQPKSAAAHSAKPDPISLSKLTQSAPCIPPKHVVRSDRRHIVAFHPVAAILCRYGDRRFPHEGEWDVLIRRGTRTDVDGLVAALDRPDERIPKNVICASVLISTPPVVLVDAAGQILFPRFPLDQCSQPQLRARNVLEHLPWKQLSVRRVKQQFTQAELSSHCFPSWKNELYFDAKFAIGRSAGGPVFTHQPKARLHACIYRTPPGSLEAGRFVRGQALDAARSARLRTALAGSGPEGSCPPQRDFAVIATSAGATVNVELGGCWRVQRGDNSGIGGADAAVVRALLKPS